MLRSIDHQHYFAPNAYVIIDIALLMAQNARRAVSACSAYLIATPYFTPLIFRCCRSPPATPAIRDTLACAI